MNPTFMIITFLLLISVICMFATCFCKVYNLLSTKHTPPAFHTLPDDPHTLDVPDDEIDIELYVVEDDDHFSV